MSKFNETLDLLKSASAWDKFSLKRFGVLFKRTAHTDLNTLIDDPRWYDPETETTTEDFIQGNETPMKISLTLAYDEVISASMDVTEDELRRLRGDRSLEKRLRQNPLQDLMLSLVDLLETDSEEFQFLEKRKTAMALAVVRDLESESPPKARDSSASHLPSTPPNSQPHFSKSYTKIDNKRKLSETSFGAQSTETTPVKLTHPEAKVQALQNTFVKTIINRLWFGKIDIPWARGRHMFLTYTEYPLSLSRSSLTVGPTICRFNIDCEAIRMGSSSVV